MKIKRYLHLPAFIQRRRKKWVVIRTIPHIKMNGGYFTLCKQQGWRWTPQAHLATQFRTRKDAEHTVKMSTADWHHDWTPLKHK